jgi:hypothetical protein
MDAHGHVVLSEQTLRRICSEFTEMPGLRLTLRQAQRLWGLDEPTCSSALAFLVNAGFLMQLGDRVYGRVSEGRVSLPPLRMAKADRIKSRDAGRPSLAHDARRASR